MALSAIAETFTLITVIPFLEIITNPKSYEVSRVGNILISVLKITEKSLPLFITIGFCFLAILSAIIRLFNLWFNSRLSASLGSSISSKAFESILLQPYIFHLYENSSQSIATTTLYLDKTVLFINFFLQFLTSIFLSSSICLALLLVNKLIAIILLLIFGSIYISLTFKLKNQLIYNSKKVSSSGQKQIAIIQESLGSIKEIIISRNYSLFIKKYQLEDQRMRFAQAQSLFLSSFPRYILESSGLTVIAFIAYFLSYQSQSEINIIPLLGAFALGSQRLLPSLQQAFSSLSKIRAESSSVENVIKALDNRKARIDLKIPTINKNEIINLKLIDLSFKFPNSANNIFSNLNLSFKKGERVGIIGKTGSGKSTILNILMGLIKPTQGSVLINGSNIFQDNLSLLNYYSSIAHVPQSVFLMDSSIAENIAFGIKKENINWILLRRCSEIAQLCEFISTLPRGFDTLVGERGNCLSGGQIQRIGIARALYREPQIIFLDEATSALDNITENNLIKALEELPSNPTIFMVAHRKNTLSSCTKILNVTKDSVKIQKAHEQY